MTSCAFGSTLGNTICQVLALPPVSVPTRATRPVDPGAVSHPYNAARYAVPFYLVEESLLFELERTAVHLRLPNIAFNRHI